MKKKSTKILIFLNKNRFFENKKIRGKIVEKYLALKSNEVNRLEYRLKCLLGKTYLTKPGVTTTTNQNSDHPCQQISNFYCEHFNNVDRFNNYWYRIKWPHVIKNKDVHMTWSIIHLALVNSWVAYCEIKGPTVRRGKKMPPKTIVEFIADLLDDLNKWIKRNKKENRRRRKRKQSIRMQSTSRKPKKLK